MMSDQTFGMGDKITMGGKVSPGPTSSPAPTINAPIATAPTLSASDLVKDSDTQGFMADVIEASKKTPVLVDFWAPWCGPCKQLGPLLEKLVLEARGALRLVKINIDENQAIAGQLRVQSIPAVFAFVDGQPVDGFMGALPEKELRAFIAKLSDGKQQANIEPVLAQAKELLDQGDFNSAAQAYIAVLQADRENVSAIAGLARCQIEAGDLEGARKTLDHTPQDKAEDSDIKSALAALELAENPVDISEVKRLLEELATKPDDHQIRFDLAMAQNSAGLREEATNNLIHIIKADREWDEDGARKQLLTFFEAWGMTDPATITGRRKLSTILFS